MMNNREKIRSIYLKNGNFCIVISYIDEGGDGMQTYEQKAYQEMLDWELSILKNQSTFQSFTKNIQNKLNSYIPEKAHEVITEGVKQMVKTTLFGSEYLTKKKQVDHMTLEEQEKQVAEKTESYRKAAVLEGAGTGAGGILLGLADFPLLLSIKMKFLFEVASIYGVDTKDYTERLYILHIFQLAFSSDKRKKEVYHTMKNWEHEKERLREVDWRVFQQEYRDYLDIIKLLQLLPGLGAVFGAYANYQLLDKLGETVLNAYRLRVLKEE
mgnify:CR=1 FL=1